MLLRLFDDETPEILLSEIKASLKLIANGKTVEQITLPLKF